MAKYISKSKGVVMELTEVSEAEAKRYMRKHYSNIPLGRRMKDYQNGAFATEYTLSGDTVCVIYTHPQTGIAWMINK